MAKLSNASIPPRALAEFNVGRARWTRIAPWIAVIAVAAVERRAIAYDAFRVPPLRLTTAGLG